MKDSETLPRGIHIHERFRLGALRARGGMATIYEGTEIPTERHVAIKFLRSDLAKNPEMVAMFKAEAEIVTKLDHPNIIRGLASGVHGGSHYIIMEFVSGPTLRERLKWGLPEKEEALSILRQAAAGLDHAHSRGVVHRDIKPDNFIIEKSVVRIGDFGIAKAGPQDPMGKDSSALGGTPIYSAPEQFRELAEIDRRVDVYSLGIVAYEMFTGKTPFTGYQPASTISHRVPKAADAVLEKAFHEDPDERYPSAGGFVSALEAVLSGFGVDSTGEPMLDLEAEVDAKKPPPPAAPAPAAVPQARPAETADAGQAAWLPWLVLAVAFAVVGLVAAKMMNVWPFASGVRGGARSSARAHVSVARPPVEAKPPAVAARFVRPDADPPAPAGSLVDVVSVSLVDDPARGGLAVDAVAIETRVTRTCEAVLNGYVNEFVEGEAYGEPRLYDINNLTEVPRVKSSSVEAKSGRPLRLHIELQHPDAVLDLDLVSGKGELTRAPWGTLPGTCEFLPGR